MGSLDSLLLDILVALVALIGKGSDIAYQQARWSSALVAFDSTIQQRFMVEAG